jgi:ankyrin repeat protein
MFVVNAFRRRRRKRIEIQNTATGSDATEKPCVRIVSRSSSVEVNRSTSRSRAGNRDNTPLGMTDVDKSMPFLYSLARSWAWEAVTFRCQTHPAEASAEHRDYLGDTVLHWAAFGHPPISTVNALLAACPETARVANRNGMLPLHVACSYRASSAVIEAILQAYPAAAAMASRDSTPLHCLCDYGGSSGADDSVLAMVVLLQSDEGMASVMMKDSRYQRRPLYILNARKNLNVQQNNTETIRNRRLRQRLIRRDRREDWPENAELQQELLERLEDDIRPFQRTEFWRKASLLVVAEYQHIIAQNDEYATPRLPSCLLEQEEEASVAAQSAILHACVGNPDCPPSLQEYAILLYEPLLLVPDSHGQLPLHLAAATYSMNSAESSSQMLIGLLEACPEAASVRDNDGRLPLSLALRQASKLNEGSSRRTQTSWTEGLAALIEANPLAMLEEDIGVLEVSEGHCNNRPLYAHVFARLFGNALFAIFQANPAILTRSLDTEEIP